MADVRLKYGKAHIPGRPPGTPQTNRGEATRTPYSRPCGPWCRPLPKTFAGKIQKFVLRERVKENVW